MKASTFIPLTILLFGTLVSYGQNVGINGDGSTPDASAILDVKATDKGMLVPRMTAAQKTAIVSPATGLLIYQTDNSPGFYYFNGTVWAGLTGSLPAWNLTGNSGTVDGTNFIGTTDNIAVNFRVNNIESGRIGNGADRSTFLGFEAGLNDDLTSNLNSFFGYTAGKSNTTGASNNAFGLEALLSNISGANNSGFGNQSLRSNTSGSGNVAIGSAVLYTNNGINNTSVGTYSSFLNSTGDNNSVVGRFALYTNTSGSNNTVMGETALYLNSTGSNNVAIGKSAGYTNTTGQSNIFIGFSADGTSNNLVNATAIGTNALVNASNKIRLGNDNVTATDVAGVLTINAQNAANSIAFPTGRGTNGQVLTTDGIGGTAWTSASGESTTASNGLTLTGTNVMLGGNLTANTSITQDNAESLTLVNNGTANTVINLQSTGNFAVQDNGTDALTVASDGQVGLKTNTPNTTLDINGGLALRRSNFAAGVVTNLSSVELTAAVTENSFIKITGPTAAFTVHGLAGGSDGKIIHIYNATGQNMTIANASATEVNIANRILTLTGANENTTGTGIVTLIYDSAASRWIVLNVRD